LPEKKNYTPFVAEKTSRRRGRSFLTRKGGTERKEGVLFILFGKKEGALTLISIRKKRKGRPAPRQSRKEKSQPHQP